MTIFYHVVHKVKEFPSLCLEKYYNILPRIKNKCVHFPVKIRQFLKKNHIKMNICKKIKYFLCSVYIDRIDLLYSIVSVIFEKKNYKKSKNDSTKEQ